MKFNCFGIKITRSSRNELEAYTVCFSVHAHEPNFRRAYILVTPRVHSAEPPTTLLLRCCEGRTTVGMVMSHGVKGHRCGGDHLNICSLPQMHPHKRNMVPKRAKISELIHKWYIFLRPSLVIVLASGGLLPHYV